MSKLPSLVHVQVQLSFVADIEFENGRKRIENGWESVPKGVIVKLSIDLSWLKAIGRFLFGILISGLWENVGNELQQYESLRLEQSWHSQYQLLRSLKGIRNWNLV
jgi:hypothetical protein